MLVTSEKLKLTPGCFSFSQRMEGLLAALPRKWLDAVEIRGLPRMFSDDDFAEILDFWRNRRVAFVRQSACLNAYAPGTFPTWQDRVFSSRQHPGPISLLSELRADFIVVRQDADPETFLWRGKHLGDPNPTNTFHQMEAHRLSQETLPGVVSCEEVDWKSYDLIVCLDVPVPSRITRQAAKTLWAYLSVEAGGPLQEDSLKRPVEGYHLFLNHCFRKYRIRPANRRHVLEFPYSFQSVAAWQQLCGHVEGKPLTRKGILIDQATAKEVPREKRPDIEVMGGEPRIGLPVRDMVSLYARHKYAVRTANFKRWGNWPVEVVQAGCLFLGRASSLDMKGCILPGLNVADLDSAKRKIDELERNPELFVGYRALQSAITEHVAFRRPLADLTARAMRFAPA